MAYYYFTAFNAPFSGETGKYLFSEDGSTWETKELPPAYSHLSVTEVRLFNDVIFLSASDFGVEGYVLSTTDMENYTEVFSDTDSMTIKDVNGILYAVGYGNSLKKYTTDGVTWNDYTSSIFQPPRGYFNGHFYKIEQGEIETSPNGIDTWTYNATGLIEDTMWDSLYAKEFNGALYFVDEQWNVYSISQPDASDLTKVEGTNPGSTDYEGDVRIATNGTILVKAAFDNNNFVQAALYTTDGTTWTDFSGNIPSGYVFVNVFYANGLFYYAALNTGDMSLGYFTSTGTSSFSSFNPTSGRFLSAMEYDDTTLSFYSGFETSVDGHISLSLMHNEDFWVVKYPTRGAVWIQNNINDLNSNYNTQTLEDAKTRLKDDIFNDLTFIFRNADDGSTTIGWPTTGCFYGDETDGNYLQIEWGGRQREEIDWSSASPGDYVRLKDPDGNDYYYWYSDGDGTEIVIDPTNDTEENNYSGTYFTFDVFNPYTKTMEGYYVYFYDMSVGASAADPAPSGRTGISIPITDPIAGWSAAYYIVNNLQNYFYASGSNISQLPISSAWTENGTPGSNYNAAITFIGTWNINLNNVDMPNLTFINNGGSVTTSDPNFSGRSIEVALNSNARNHDFGGLRSLILYYTQRTDDLSKSVFELYLDTPPSMLVQFLTQGECEGFYDATSGIIVGDGKPITGGWAFSLSDADGNNKSYYEYRNYSGDEDYSFNMNQPNIFSYDEGELDEPISWPLALKAPTLSSNVEYKQVYFFDNSMTINDGSTYTFEVDRVGEHSLSLGQDETYNFEWVKEGHHSLTLTNEQSNAFEWLINETNSLTFTQDLEVKDVEEYFEIGPTTDTTLDYFDYRFRPTDIQYKYNDVHWFEGDKWHKITYTDNNISYSLIEDIGTYSFKSNVIVENETDIVYVVDNSGLDYYRKRWNGTYYQIDENNTNTSFNSHQQVKLLKINGYIISVFVDSNNVRYHILNESDLSIANSGIIEAAPYCYEVDVEMLGTTDGIIHYKKDAFQYKYFKFEVDDIVIYDTLNVDYIGGRANRNQAVKINDSRILVLQNDYGDYWYYFIDVSSDNLIKTSTTYLMSGYNGYNAQTWQKIIPWKDFYVMHYQDGWDSNQDGILHFVLLQTDGDTINVVDDINTGIGIHYGSVTFDIDEDDRLFYQYWDAIYEGAQLGILTSPYRNIFEVEFNALAENSLTLDQPIEYLTEYDRAEDTLLQIDQPIDYLFDIYRAHRTHIQSSGWNIAQLEYDYDEPTPLEIQQQNEYLFEVDRTDIHELTFIDESERGLIEKNAVAENSISVNDVSEGYFSWGAWNEVVENSATISCDSDGYLSYGRFVYIAVNHLHALLPGPTYNVEFDRAPVNRLDIEATSIMDFEFNASGHFETTLLHSGDVSTEYNRKVVNNLLFNDVSDYLMEADISEKHTLNIESLSDILVEYDRRGGDDYYLQSPSIGKLELWESETTPLHISHNVDYFIEKNASGENVLVLIPHASLFNEYNVIEQNSITLTDESRELFEVFMTENMSLEFRNLHSHIAEILHFFQVEANHELRLTAGEVSKVLHFFDRAETTNLDLRNDVEVYTEYNRSAVHSMNIEDEGEWSVEYDRDGKMVVTITPQVDYTFSGLYDYTVEIEARSFIITEIEEKSFI